MDEVEGEGDAVRERDGERDGERNGAHEKHRQQERECAPAILLIENSSALAILIES